MAELADRYAEAIHQVATAEGDPRGVANELFEFSQTLQGNEELRAALSDPQIPASRRQGIVEDLLGGRVSAATSAAVSMVVAAGRAGELPAIISALVDRTAASGNRAVAVVRTAVPIDADQMTRLAEALKARTGRDVEIKAILDPSVQGGVYAQIGDTVIDGTVRRKLAKLREAF